MSRSSHRGEQRGKSRWLIPPAIVIALAVLVFLTFYLLDHYVTGVGDKSSRSGPISSYVAFESETLTDAISAMAAMIAAVLGIVITVVSIIVQLSADRYTGVTRMFLNDRANQIVIFYYVVACVCAVWLSVSLQSHFVPRALLLVVMVATSLGIVLMLPYFRYVFWFLEPENIVDRLRTQAAHAIKNATYVTSPEHSALLQVSALSAMEELTDITSNSISGKDKIIASRAVDALKNYCLDYLHTAKVEYLVRKGEAGEITLTDFSHSGEHEIVPAPSDHIEVWFRIGDGLRQNPDFVAMDPESLSDLEHRRTWFEWKILRQYLGIYNEALNSMRDINYLIAINTRYIGEAAADLKDREVIRLVFRFMNSYMRATLNAKEVRTAYNVLNQYRLLVESMLRKGYGAIALDGVNHMNYYGQVSYDMNLTFVTETVAYDVSTLCQIAHARKAREQDEMLNAFLDLDQPLQVKSQEKGLLGVRKAQVKLAAYYLSVNEVAKARLIAEDMREEPAQRLMVIRDQLERVTSKDFWEIIDRGRNFEYMPPHQRLHMATFFDWLGINDAAAEGSS